MELDNLQKSWNDIANNIEILSAKLTENTDIAKLSKKSDIRSRLLRRAYFGCAVTAICIPVLAISPLLNPSRLPYPWLISFCAALLIGLLVEIYIASCIKRIDIHKLPNSIIINNIITIKKLRRNFEIWVDAIVVAFFIWLSFDSKNIWDALLLWTVATTGIVLGFIIYKRDTADFDEIINWCK